LSSPPPPRAPRIGAVTDWGLDDETGDVGEAVAGEIGEKEAPTAEVLTMASFAMATVIAASS